MSKRASILSKLGGKSKTGNDKQKTWLHDPISLTQNFVVYQAKLLGVLKVQESKGVDTVKDATRKLKLAHEINKSEAGNKGSKLPKVELWVSVDMVKVVHAKTKVALHEKQLHRISYCADDHFETKLFAFIAKDDVKGEHECFVFITEKEASELTWTVGQAFELAYQRYLQKRGAADLMRSRESMKCKKGHSQNGNATVQDNDTERQEGSSQMAEEEHPTKDILLTFDTTERANECSIADHQSSAADDPFEQYLASVASRGAVTSDHVVAESPVLFEKTLLTEAEEKKNNPFLTTVHPESTVGNNSPQLPRPKPSGTPISTPPFPHALPRPPSKKDIKMNSGMARLKVSTGSEIQTTTESSKESVASNPFKADFSPHVDLMSTLECDFTENTAVNSSQTFDPFR